VSSYDAILRYYDADHADFAEDLPFYRELARRTAGPVLEAMCGSGRLLVPLARDVRQLTGVDSSPGMLALAHERIAAAGLRSRVSLAEADIRRTALGGPFSLAFVALNSFMHLTAVVDQLDALARLKDALVPGGLLALDLFNPDARALSETDGALTLDRTFTLADGARVQKFVAQRVDMARQTSHVTFLYDELDERDLVRRTTHTFRMRWLYRYELEHLLARSGFAIEAVYGSYDLDPFGSGDLMLTVARRV
jgi:SAM-dependent methyltransferase